LKMTHARTPPVFLSPGARVERKDIINLKFRKYLPNLARL
jgi:hypothetical protein